MRSIFKKVSILFLMVFSTGFEVEADGGKAVTIEVNVSEFPESDSSGLGEVEGQYGKVEATVEPGNADNQNVKWYLNGVEFEELTEEDMTVANVAREGGGTVTVTAVSEGEATITAVSPGSATVTAKIIIEDIVYDANCYVSVAFDGSPLETDTLIYGAFEDGTQAEAFEAKEDVYIVGQNIPVSKYYVKVVAQGKQSEKVLGSGEVEDFEINDDGYVKFNLFEVTGFSKMTKNNNEYFVYMSANPDYPKDDEKTLKTNFKIESAVPTGQIAVTTEFVGGYRTDKSGVKFILGRILYEAGPDLAITEQYLDYVVETAPNGYSDEVKAWGITDENGEIKGEVEIWDGVSDIEPGKWYSKELLKIGGYMLLEEPIDDYEDNLDELNDESDDGSLLKEVHITRNGIEVRDVVNTYVGGGDE